MVAVVGLLGGMNVGLASPAFAASESDCIDDGSPSDNTRVASIDSLESLQSAIDNVDFAVVCISGTFGVPTPLDPFQAFLLDVPRSVTLYGLDDAVLDGGGVMSLIYSFTPLTVQNLTLQSGYSTFGGAIAVNDVSIDNSQFLSNAAISSGGAIESDGDITITNSVFRGNTAINGGGGAIRLYGGTLTIVDSTFSGNEAPDAGGAVESGGAVSISSSTFVGNEAFEGGAVSARSVDVSNSTFVENAALNLVDGELNHGGAIYTQSGSVAFSTIVGNTAGTPIDGGDVPGDSIYLETNTGGRSIVLRGNIFIGDDGRPQLGVGDVTGSEVSEFVDFGGNVFSTSAETELYLVADESTQFSRSIDEVLGQERGFGFNGGPTLTFALPAGSPAIDAVPPFTSPGSAPALSAAAIDVDVDQRGVPRTGYADAGSYEYVAPAADGPEELAATGVDVNLGAIAGASALLLVGGFMIPLVRRRRRSF